MAPGATSSELDNPLAWMDAVDRVRTHPETRPTPLELQGRIQALYADQGIPLPPAVAARAVQHLLAPAPLPSPAQDSLPAGRPRSPDAWHAAVKAADRKARRDRYWNRGVWLVVASSIATALFQGWANIAHSAGRSMGAGLIGMALVFGMVGSALFSSLFFRTRGKAMQADLKAALPTETDLEAIRTWLTVPDLAHTLVALRQSGVPLLNQDLRFLQSRFQAHQAALQARLAQAKRTVLQEEIDRTIDGWTATPPSA
jgi:hypothetical protein